MIYLYKLVNLTKDKTYIGVTKNPKYRKTRHLCGFGSKEVAKELEDKFEFTILACGEGRYIFDLEKEAIKAFNSKSPNGYNLTDGGEAGPSKSGTSNPKAKLCEDDILDIRVAYSAGATQVDLAEKYKVSRTNIGSIVRGETWPNSGGPITKNRIKRVSEEEKYQIQKLYSQYHNENTVA